MTTVGLTVSLRRQRNGNGIMPHIEGVAFSNRGLTIDGEIEIENWNKIGDTLDVVEGAVQWWVGDWLNYGENRYGDKYAAAIESTGREYQTLINTKTVATAFEFNRRRLNLSWSHHAEVAAIAPVEADKLLDKAESEGWSKRELRKQVYLYRHNELEPPAFPPGKFRVFYADPPWQYADERTLTQASGAAQTQYPTMDTEAICALHDKDGRAVQDLARDGSVCFLWATAPLLPDALRVLESWGFEYKAMFVWDKKRSYNGHYNAVRHEMLLIGTHGSATPDTKELRDSVISCERTVHSRKPPEFYTVIESMYSRGPYVEVFAREKRKGWSAFGNQL